MSREHPTMTTRPDRHELDQCGIRHAPAGHPCRGAGTEHTARRWFPSSQLASGDGASLHDSVLS